MSAPPPPPSSDARLVDALRGDLEHADWTAAGVDELLGPEASAALSRDQVVPARRAVRRRAGEPAAALAALFLLAEPIPRRDLDAALPALGAAGAERLGLVRAGGAGPGDPVVAACDLRPWAMDGEPAGWLASDLGELALGGPVPTDHVLGVGGASTTLAQLTVRAPVGRVLDVGTGSGVQALAAARHARSVTATDTSGRALAFAAFNAALAGVALDLRRGSLLEPVAGERFDLVVSNPPFVVTPRRPGVPGWSYRDGGGVGDEVVAALVAGLGGVLAPGGSAQLLGSWEHRRGEGWRDRVTGWLDAAGLDGWVVQRDVADPATYAETWVRDGGQRPGPAFDALVEAWLDDFEERGVDAVGSGYLVLHRPAREAGGARPWRRVEELTGPVPGPLGAHVGAVLAAREALRGTDDAALAALALRVAPDVTEERHHVPGAGDPSVIVLRQGAGFARARRADTALAALVGASDGELGVGQVVTALAALLAVDEQQLRAQLLPAVRRLVEDQFLLLP